jgi:hypothetical protein
MTSGKIEHCAENWEPVFQGAKCGQRDPIRLAEQIRDRLALLPDHHDTA